MNSPQKLIILIYGFINLVIFLKGLYESKYKNNVYGLTPPLSFLGIFVWGDAVIFGIFWTLCGLVAIILNDWYLFLLLISLFWLVRSLGETIYWFNQQFSNINRNPPKTLHWFSFFQNDSIWFIHQIIWQCLTVISLVSSIYLTKLWLDTRF